MFFFVTKETVYRYYYGKSLGTMGEMVSFTPIAYTMWQYSVNYVALLRKRKMFNIKYVKQHK